MAKSGINAVAVIDTRTNQVLGHISAGWYPAAVALSTDGENLYILNNKGKGAGPNYIHEKRYYTAILNMAVFRLFRSGKSTTIFPK